MRNLASQCQTIRVTSVSGELRDINVSGLAKARLNWLFRNFSILDFSVLSGEQQRLVSRMWETGSSADAAVDPLLDLIGTVEGFPAKPHQPAAPVKLPHAALPAKPPSGHAAPVNLSQALRPAVWIAAAVVIVGCATFIGPEHRSTPQSRVVTAANNSTSPARVSAQVPAEPPPHVAALPASAPAAASISLPRLPDAMSTNASSEQPKPAPPVTLSALVVSTKAPHEKQEVFLRVGVDGKGRAQTLHYLRGDQKKISAALHAAKLWHYQPCSASAQCEHTIKFTDYGDASIVQVLE